tara:strand:+ start:418 stop:810 length:393 start_codon:yes stop_codon:yes gene_type:complete
MASVLKVDQITGVTTAGSITVTGEGNSTTTNLQQGLAKAWVHASGAAVQDDTFNVSGGTDHGTGDYSHTITNPFSNLNYCQHSTAEGTSADRNATRNSDRDATSTLATECAEAGTKQDTIHMLSAFGDLA